MIIGNIIFYGLILLILCIPIGYFIYKNRENFIGLSTEVKDDDLYGPWEEWVEEKERVLITSIPQIQKRESYKGLRFEDEKFTTYYDTDNKSVTYVLKEEATMQEMYSRTKEHWMESNILPRFYFPLHCDFKRGYNFDNVKGLPAEVYLDWYTQYGWKVYMVNYEY